MASITVDVDLDDFDTDEILDEIEHRYNRKYGLDKKLIQEWAEDFLEVEKPQTLTVIDQMKLDFFMENFHRIKLNDLENLI
jgi:hypothetical protein